MLLADVRSGFANRKTGDSNFSIKKVHKVNLNDKDVQSGVSVGQGEASSKFVRGGFGRVSMKKLMFETIAQDDSMDVDSPSTPTLTNGTGSVRRNRDDVSDDKLISFLSQNKDCDKANGFKPERVGSLRRRRLERRERRSVLDPVLFGRERAASPNVESPDTNNDSSNSVPMRNSVNRSMNRPASEELASNNGQSRRGLRRSRSLLDKRDMEQALSESNRPNTPDVVSESDETDGVLERSRRRLLRRSMRVKGEKDKEHSSTESDMTEVTPTPPPKTQAPSPVPPSPEPDSEWQQRGSMRWRSNVPSDLRSLQTIVEKERLDVMKDTQTVPPSSPCTDAVPAPKIQKLSPEPLLSTPPSPPSSEKADESVASIERSKEQLARIYSVIDQAEIDQILNSIGEIDDCREDMETSGEPENRHVSVSVRAKINRRWHSDLGEGAIDKILKAIDESGTPIDRVKNPGGLVKAGKNTRKDISNKSAISASLSPRAPRKTSVVRKPSLRESMESKDAAVRQRRKQRAQVSPDDIQKVLKDGPVRNIIDRVAKSPRPVTSSSRVTRSISLKEKARPVSSTDKPKTEEPKEARTPKLTGKRKFRADRFGEKESNEQSRARSRSNVEKEAVEQALTDLQGTMSRSKSYDEAVAKAQSSTGETVLHKDSNSNPEVSNHRAVRRTGSVKLPADGRRHSRYIPGDDSDSDAPASSRMTPRRRKSKDSPKNLSRSSVCSANTSTETLRAENISGESSPEQRRKISEANSYSNNQDEEFVNERNMRNHTERLVEDKEGVLRRVELQASTLDEESPSARMARWRLKRHGQNSGDQYDINENRSPNLLHPDDARADSYMPTIIHESQTSNLSSLSEGSRASFASDRDEGFESQSQGTVSQRTSLCSGPEEGSITPTLARKQFFKKLIEVADDANNPTIMNAMYHGNSYSHDKVDSWTDKDSLLNSSMDSSNIALDESYTDPVISPKGGMRSKSSDPKPRNSKLVSLPSYMRGTSSSANKVGRDSPVKRPSSAAARSPAGSRNLNKSISGSNNSVASTAPSDTQVITRSATMSPSKRKVLASSLQASSSRLSAGTPTSSRSSTPSTANSPFRRTQSVRLSSSARRSLGPESSPSSGRDTPSKTGVSRTPSFMSPTSASKQRSEDQPKSDRKSLPSSLTSPTQSSLVRSGSTRTSARSPAPNSVRKDALASSKDKTKLKSDNKMKSLISKIGNRGKQEMANGNTSLESECISEGVEMCEDILEVPGEENSLESSSKDKSPSFFRRIVAKGKEKASVRKSDGIAKTEVVDKSEKKKRSSVQNK